MDHNTFAWAIGIASLFGILFHFGLLIFACAADSDESQAKRYAVTGLAILALCGPLQWLLRMFMGKLVGPGTFFPIQAVGIWVFMLVRWVAMGFIVAGVFTGRNRTAKPNDAGPSTTDKAYVGTLAGTKAETNADPNPYTFPSG